MSAPYPPEPIIKDNYGGEGYMTPDGWVTQDNGTDRIPVTAREIRDAADRLEREP